MVLTYKKVHLPIKDLQWAYTKTRTSQKLKRFLDLNKLDGNFYDEVIWSIDDEFLARFPVITSRLVHACNARDSFGREQAGSSNLRGDIASITSFIRETCRMERRAVEVTVGESTRCALHARAFL